MTSRDASSAAKVDRKAATPPSRVSGDLSSSGLGRYITSKELAAAARRTHEAATRRLKKD